jgi:hypothetical protein
MVNSIERIEVHLEPEVEEIGKFSTGVQFLLKKMSELEIATDEECKAALRIAGEAKTLYKQIEDVRKRAIEPSRKVIAVVNDAAKYLTQQLDNLAESINIKLAMWHKTLEDQAKVAKESAKQLSDSLGLNIDIYVPEAPKTLSNEYAVASKKIVWEFEVSDEASIPREYLSVDEKKIKEAVKAGIREIPGVKIWEGSTMTIRRR